MIEEAEQCRPKWFQSRGATAISAFLVCLFFLLFLVRVWQIDLNVPFAYDGDGLYFLSVVRGLLHNQSWLHNSELGFPWGAEFRDFPVNLPVDYGLLWIGGKIQSSPGMLLNIYWMLSSAVTAGLGAYSFLRLGVERSVALGAGVLYALQPFSTFHVRHFVLMFYCVPILAGFSIEWLSAKSTSSSIPSKSWMGQLPWPVRIAAIIQGMSYVYNTFFACLFFCVAAFLQWIRYRRWSRAGPGLIVIGLLVTGFLISTSPNFAFWATHGTNPEMNYKTIVETEMLSLKIRHLLTPISNHPLGVFRAIAAALDRPEYAYETENRGARLGSAGTLGFLLLLGYGLIAMLGGDFRWQDRRLGAAAALTIAALLIGTVGGFDGLIAQLSSQIRAYNRIVVFIDYFSLLALAIVLTAATRRWRPLIHRSAGGSKSLTRWFQWTARAAAALVLTYLVFDETSGRLFGDSSRTAQYLLVESSVKQIEPKLESDAAVFNLPYREFPIEKASGNMNVYDHFLPYISSHSLRFSYGAIPGRGAQWSSYAAALPVPKMAERLALAGFSAVWVDSAGYASPQDSPLTAFLALPGTALLLNSGRFAVVDLRTYRRNLLTGLSPAETEVRMETAVNPVYAAVRDGFFAGEASGASSFHWCSRNGTVVLNNPGKMPRTVTTQFTIRGVPYERRIAISFPGGQENLTAAAGGMLFRKTFTIPPHQQRSIQFRAEGDPWFAPGDPRALYFGVWDLSVEQ